MSWDRRTQRRHACVSNMLFSCNVCILHDYDEIIIYMTNRVAANVMLPWLKNFYMHNYNRNVCAFRGNVRATQTKRRFHGFAEPEEETEQ